MNPLDETCDPGQAHEEDRVLRYKITIHVIQIYPQGSENMFESAEHTFGILLLLWLIMLIEKAPSS